MARAAVQNLSPSRLMRPLLIVCAIFYLSYHVMHGERGLFALFKEMHRHEVLTKQLEASKTERLAIEQRVQHMRDDSLDLDLLDEQMRRMMGLMRADEVVILMPKS